MAQYKCTLFFTASTEGWTERYFPNASDLASAITAMNVVIPTRMDLSTTEIELQAAALSDVAIRGDSVPFLATPLFGTITDATGYVDVDIALLAKWQVGVFTRNKTFLRGIPNGEQSDGTLQPSLGYLGAINSYQNAVIANCLMPAILSPNPTPPPKYLYIYSAILAGTIKSNLARRKTGRPFGLPRGRRVAP